MEGHVGPGRVDLDRFRDQRVEREGLILRARHQRLEDIADEALRRGAGLHIERVEAVEGAGQADAQAPALLRVRVGIGEVVEIGRKRRGPMHGDAMRRLGRAGRGGRGDDRRDGQREGEMARDTGAGANRKQ